jgi:hypothetical protein
MWEFDLYSQSPVWHVLEIKREFKREFFYLCLAGGFGNGKA